MKSGFDSKSMVDLIAELPVWVMNPDYERVSILNSVLIPSQNLAF